MFNHLDINYNIALHLPLPDVLSICHVKEFNTICHDNHFWLEKLKLDFPNKDYDDYKHDYKQNYIKLYNEAFVEFKREMALYPFDKNRMMNQFNLAGELSLFLDEKPYIYITNSEPHHYPLKPDLYIAQTALWGSNVKKLYNAPYLLIQYDDPYLDVNAYVTEGKAIALSAKELRDLDLSPYTHYYNHMSNLLINMDQWSRLGFITIV